MSIYEEIEAITQDLIQKSTDDLMYDISEKFIELRNTARKQHFGESEEDALRSAALNLSASCIAMAKRIDFVDKA